MSPIAPNRTTKRRNGAWLRNLQFSHTACSQRPPQPVSRYRGRAFFLNAVRRLIRDYIPHGLLAQVAQKPADRRNLVLDHDFYIRRQHGCGFFRSHAQIAHPI